MRDSELLKRPDYTKLSDLYRKYFSLGSLGESINLKFALISLLGYMVNSMKKKRIIMMKYHLRLQHLKMNSNGLLGNIMKQLQV